MSTPRDLRLGDYPESEVPSRPRPVPVGMSVDGPALIARKPNGRNRLAVLSPRQTHKASRAIRDLPLGLRLTEEIVSLS